jgi:hypothetical protein
MLHQSRLTPARVLNFLVSLREGPCRGPPGTARRREALTGRLGASRLLGAWFVGDE